MFVDKEDNAGCTPLHYAAFYGQTEIAECLMSYGADYSIEDKKSLKPLHYAVSRTGNLSLVNLLLPDAVNVRYSRSETLLHHAARCGRKQVIQFLFKKGADLNVRDFSGKTPLQDAIHARNPEAIATLIEKGAKFEREADEIIHVEDEEGLTALHFAAAYGQLDAVKILLKAGANIDAEDRAEDQTALHLAVINHQIKVVKALLRKGVDINAEDRYGRAALDYAESINI